MNPSRSAALGLFLAPLLAAFGARASSDWPGVGGDPALLRHSSLDQINRSNVSSLEVAWTFRSGGASTSPLTAIQCTPVVVAGTMYLTSPDTQAIAAIECLKRNGIRGAFADYWTAYKLTFLAGEEIIVAPTDGIDRYPRYTEFVRSLPAHERLDDAEVCLNPRAGN